MTCVLVRPLVFSFAAGITRSDFGTLKRVQNRGAENLIPAPQLNELAGLHVVQRAATPAREPAPIGVDIIPRAIIPAGVESMPAATASLIRVVPFFRPTTALFIRLFA